MIKHFGKIIIIFILTSNPPFPVYKKFQ